MFKIVGVFALIKDKNNRILLSHRNDMNVWNMPGGRVEEGESLFEALQREVCEEAGLKVIPVKLINVNEKTKKNEIVFTFLCKVKSGKLKISNEANEHKWFGVNKLPLNIVTKQLERILNYYYEPENIFMNSDDSSSTRELYQKGKLSDFNRKIIKKYLSKRIDN